MSSTLVKMTDNEQEIEEFKHDRYETIREAENRLGADHQDVVEMRRVADLAIAAYSRTLLNFDEPEHDNPSSFRDREGLQKANTHAGNLWNWMSKMLGLSK